MEDLKRLMDQGAEKLKLSRKYGDKLELVFDGGERLEGISQSLPPLFRIVIMYLPGSFTSLPLLLFLKMRIFSNDQPETLEVFRDVHLPSSSQ